MLRGSYVVLAVVVLISGLFAVEAFYYYHYHQRYYAGPGEVAAGAKYMRAEMKRLAGSQSTISGETTAREATVALSSASSSFAFVQHARRNNVSQNSTFLDNPQINGDPHAILIITQSWNPDGKGGLYNSHPVGVWYDGRAKRWAIFNQDLVPMSEGAAFNVLVLKR